jgi:quercetin dioxygenase-like cupin family protein
MELDAVKLDPKHYTVEFENEQVRVLRIRYGPGETSVMHEHPEAVAVFLTDGRNSFSYPDGSTEEVSFKAGDVQSFPAVRHNPRNLGDERFELVLVELKAKR